MHFLHQYYTDSTNSTKTYLGEVCSGENEVTLVELELEEMASNLNCKFQFFHFSGFLSKFQAELRQNRHGNF